MNLILVTILVSFCGNKQILATENTLNLTSVLPTLSSSENASIEAIVNDQTVQNAVKSTVQNGSLYGLVVKKKTVIAPVEAPNHVTKIT